MSGARRTKGRLRQTAPAFAAGLPGRAGAGEVDELRLRTITGEATTAGALASERIRRDGAPTTVLAGSPEDRVWLDRLRAGDEAAFTALVEQHHGALVRLARAFVGTQEAAEEVAQDTWLAVLNGLKAFEGRSTLKTWIFSILTNRAKTRGQRDKRWVPLVEAGTDGSAGTESDGDRFTPNGSWAAPPGHWDAETPETLLLQREALEAVDRAIAGLPPGQQAVLILRDVEGMASEDVCQALELSATNQRVLLHRGRSKVRAAVERYLQNP
jgi:RNA polymerase sigma-70 factor, ECF subfamily